MTNNERIIAKIKREQVHQARYREKIDKSSRRGIELRRKLVDAYSQLFRYML